MRASKIQDTRPKILFIVGPTASGKSGLAMRIAEEHGGEIVCADSQTVRRGLDIGTAKPTVKDRKTVRHHMLDIIDPYDRYSVAEFKDAANRAIEGILSRGKIPVVVGGTGLYIDALLYDFNFRGSSSEYSREDLEAMSAEQLQKLIVDSGYKMPENEQNPRHLIRTIESEGQVSEKSVIRDGAIIVGIDPGPEVLLERIKQRVDIMLERGFLDEVEGVIEKYGEPQPALNFDAIGYKIALDNRLEQNVYDVEKIKEQFVSSDRKYSKRQRSWLKRNKDIEWFEHADDAYEYLKGLLKKH